MRNAFLFLLINIPLLGFSQGYGNQWALGIFQNVYLNFNDSLSSDSLHSNLQYQVTSTDICDSMGSLLFYSDGRLVMNRNGDTMMNGFGFSPHLAAFVDYAYGPDLGFQSIQGNGDFQKHRV